jgi:hypothetical protein
VPVSDQVRYARLLILEACWRRDLDGFVPGVGGDRKVTGRRRLGPSILGVDHAIVQRSVRGLPGVDRPRIASLHCPTAILDG